MSTGELRREVVGGVTTFLTMSYVIEKLEEAVPAYATMLLIPLTSSIAQGILWGFVLHVVCFTLAGRAREVPRGMGLLAVVAAGSLWLENPRP